MMTRDAQGTHPPRTAHRWGVREPVRSLVIVVAAAFSGGSLLWTLVTGFVDPRTALAFGVLIAVGELARITLPGHREVAPVASAGAIGYSFLLSIGGHAVHHSSWQVLAVVTMGFALGELPHIAAGRTPDWGDLARRVMIIVVITLPFRPYVSELAPTPQKIDWWLVLVIMAGLVLAGWLTDAVIAAAIRAEPLRGRFAVALRDELHAHFGLGMAIGSSGILIALASSVTGLAGLLVFTAPLLVTQVAFRRFAEIRLTYLQTVRALSRVTEVGGYVATGHSRRVSRLAKTIGTELGMRESELLELEYAALMHDIGQLSLRDPIANGATVYALPREQRRIAELGSAVIRETGVLDTVAELVRRQCEPCTGDGESDPPPLGSRIIKVANAIDDLVSDSTDSERVQSALERLRMDAGTEYDPEVVEAAARVIARSSERR
ncbi:HD domain-containing protein [Streptomonospora sp. S1-112]|uniref:HD domain-containing protein n=1 Tax=Streptomonospora mangrovi TaxID=2883123 RepID=A0A9X3NG51_9ACTN|nr:HD domain-containing phosphohydrolase [Streptomonospora mangrovi]MDA0562942.1 HD domain-containing protein [Streptomonospora mangrovi]